MYPYENSTVPSVKYVNKFCPPPSPQSGILRIVEGIATCSDEGQLTETIEASFAPLSKEHWCCGRLYVENMSSRMPLFALRSLYDTHTLYPYDSSTGHQLA